MKTASSSSSITRAAALLLASFGLAGSLWAGSTIDATERFAWAENIGWTNWRYDTGNPGEGATIGQFFCAGLLYGENVGWIKLGTGAPANGVQYGNTGASDFGVNHDGAGNLTGLAWGENIGWMKFEQTSGKPKIDFVTGEFSGYAWSENCGWINLGNGALPALKTETIAPGPDSDGDMIADAWELEQAMNAGLGAVLTHLDKTSDRDGDGESDFEEYLADSDPFDAGDALRIVDITINDPMADDITLEWTSSPRRVYDLGAGTDLNLSVVLPDLPPDPGATTAIVFNDPIVPRKFWRVGAKLPLGP